MPSNVAIVVLAAGLSRRMGADNKLLAEIDGVPMLVQVLRQALASRANYCVVVLGHQAERVQACIDQYFPAPGERLHCVYNRDFADGMSTALRAGLAALADNTAGALIHLGDMPGVVAGDMDALLEAFDKSNGPAIVAPFYQQQRGNPVLWPRKYFARLGQLTGDQGARVLLSELHEEVCVVPTSHAGVLRDIDTPEDLQHWSSLEVSPRSITP